MKPWIPLATTLALAASMTATAQDSTDPHLGTWVLNLSKSKFDPGPAPKSETRTFDTAPDGMSRLTVQVTTANGTSRTEVLNFKRDGKPYVMTNQPNNDANAVTGVNGREDRVTMLRKGKVIGHLTSVISKDGKVMTETQTGTNPAGQTFHNSLIYDRQ